MSIIRFGSDGSDVYVYYGDDYEGRECLVCCGCNIGHAYNYDTEEDMIEHLDAHRAAGQVVPDIAYARLQRAIEERTT